MATTVSSHSALPTIGDKKSTDADITTENTAKPINKTIAVIATLAQCDDTDRKRLIPRLAASPMILTNRNKPIMTKTVPRPTLPMIGITSDKFCGLKPTNLAFTNGLTIAMYTSKFNKGVTIVNACSFT